MNKTVMGVIVFSYDVEIDEENDESYNGVEPHIFDQRMYEDGSIGLDELTSLASEQGRLFVRLMPAPDGWTPDGERARQPLEFIPGWDAHSHPLDVPKEDGVEIFDLHARVIGQLVRDWDE